MKIHTELELRMAIAQHPKHLIAEHRGHGYSRAVGRCILEVTTKYPIKLHYTLKPSNNSRCSVCGRTYLKHED